MKSTIVIQQIKQTLLATYGVMASKIYPVERGTNNHSFFVESKKGKYVFRVYSNKNKRTKEHILFEIKVMNLLRKNRLPIPQIFKNNHEEYLTSQIYNGKRYYCMLMKFVEGKVLGKNDTYIAKELGKLQAKMHVVLEKKVKKRLNVNQIFNNWSKWSSEELRKIKPFLKKYHLEKVYLQGFNETQAGFKKGLKDIEKIPYAECHNDFWGGNILIKNKHVMGILDFDSMNASLLVADLANTLKSFLLRSNPKQYNKIIQEYLAGYQKYRKLSKNELEILPLMTAMRNFAVTNLIFAKGIRKDKKRILEAIKFHNNWKKYILIKKTII